ncbi:glycosyltransferase [Hasllibacter sp. MH4015]|uniref:glycosyltransferase n=1 Tax=Hasllibacter sp. MH4015 TaxID=2854029 RepID=UPI001CD3738E|nr:glycosyltransferase [Hasllibacter sp. MH4015]
MGVVNKIIGVCRFSYLGDAGFETLKGGAEEAARQLYAPGRMQRRFAYFENICIPSLANQTDQDFVLVALIGDTMPFHFRKRLKRLADKHAFLRVVTLEAAGPLNSTRRAFRRGLDEEEADFITGFRLDDDDAVACDYIEKTREISDNLIQLGWAHADTPAAVCFHRGIYWDMKREDDPFWDYSEVMPLGLASAMIAPPEAMANIYRWNHRKLAAHARCWIDPHDYMFVRTLHGHNDSDRSIPPRARQLPEWQARKLFRERFGLNPKRLLPMMRKLQEDGSGMARQLADEARADLAGDGDGE